MPTLPTPDSPLPPPPLLEYQNPATARPITGRWSNPLYPLALAILSTVLGLFSRDALAALSALGLVIATLWYIATRIAPDRHLHLLWRLVLVAAAMTSLVLTTL